METNPRTVPHGPNRCVRRAGNRPAKSSSTAPTVVPRASTTGRPSTNPLRGVGISTRTVSISLMVSPFHPSGSPEDLKERLLRSGGGGDETDGSWGPMRRPRSLEPPHAVPRAPDRSTRAKPAPGRTRTGPRDGRDENGRSPPRGPPERPPARLGEVRGGRSRTAGSGRPWPGSG